MSEFCKRIFDQDSRDYYGSLRAQWAHMPRSAHVGSPASIALARPKGSEFAWSDVMFGGWEVEREFQVGL
jgi:hypothetical protein